MSLISSIAAQVSHTLHLEDAPVTPVFTTSRRTEALTTARLNDDATPHGFLMGNSVTTGKPWSFSLHEKYRNDEIQSLNMVIYGAVGYGKTSWTKCYIDWLVRADGFAGVFDRKIQTSQGVRGGEYFSLVDELDGTRIVFDQNPDVGCHLNILDPAFQAAESTSTLGPDKLLLLAAQVACGASLDNTSTAFPQFALNAAHQTALRRAKADGRVATIEDVIGALYTPDESTIPGPVNPVSGRKLLAEAGRVSTDDLFRWGLPVAVGLERYTTGDLAGLIDGPTRDAAGQPLDLRNHLIVFDTSALAEGSDEFGLMTLLAAALLQTEWVYQPGDKLLVREEAYSSDMLPQIGQLWRVFAKRGRGHGLATIDIFHHPSEALLGEQASTVAKEAAVTMIARQDHPADVEACVNLLGVPPRAAGLLSTQPVGTWMMCIPGRPVEQVHHLRTRRQVALTNSDMGVMGDADGIEVAS